MATTALVLSSLATVAGAVETSKQVKKQEEEAKKSRVAATLAQDEQEALAEEEKKRSSEELAESQRRLIKGTSGRTGLLFGAETGVDTNLKTTLGA